MFPEPDCDQFKPFHFSWFWNSTWQIPNYTHFLSFHPPHCCTKHWHSGVCSKPKERKGSAASCGEVEAWQFLGWSSNERPCSSLLTWMGCPPSELEVWAMRAVWWECTCVCVCGGGGVPSCRHRVCQVQHYNSSGIVWPVCLFCVSEEERSRSSFHLLLV